MSMQFILLLLLSLPTSQDRPSRSRELPNAKEGEVIDLTNPKHRVTLMEEYKQHLNKMQGVLDRFAASKNDNEKREFARDQNEFFKKYAGRTLRVVVPVNSVRGESLGLKARHEFKGDVRPFLHRDRTTALSNVLVCELIGYERIESNREEGLGSADRRWLKAKEDGEVKAIGKLTASDHVVLECRVVDVFGGNLGDGVNQAYQIRCVVMRWEPSTEKKASEKKAPERRKK